MQFNTDLLQTLSLNTKGTNPSVDSANSLEGNASGEFLSLLTEAKELAKSGVVTPNEFMASLTDEGLDLNPNEKKALAKSFMDFMPKTEGEVALQSDGQLAKSEKSNSQSLQSLLGTTTASKNIKVPSSVQGNVGTVDSANVEMQSEAIDPKIANGKLLSLNAHKSAKSVKMPVQSAQDFVNQNQALGKAATAEQAGVVRKSFFPKSKSQIGAFNKEQNTISKSVFAGKNPFTSNESNPLNTTNITTNESALFQAVEGADTSSALQNMMMESSALKTGAATAAMTSNISSNVLDLSSINIQNTEQIIDKISDYINTSRLENQDSVELLVKHDSLGQFKVVASKGELPDQVNLEIAAASEKGKAFFKDNEVEMIKNLSKSGVKLGDVKVALTSDSSFQSSDKNDGNTNQNNNGFNSSKNQHASSGRQESGRERREELWNMYRERLGA
jgi:hypothetical protein